jgi:pyruvate,water dikinase
MELARRAATKGGEADFERFCMLTFDELPGYLADPPSFASVIEERYQFYERLSEVDPPFVVAGQPPSLEQLEVEQPDLGWVPPGTELQGAGGSPGVVAGRARVILDASDPTALEPGDILIAPITDPSWTPLFMPAGGVVVDVGAIQSHAVVVSRELCIPCVVSVKRATEIIPDGSWIEIDGSQGTVKVLEHPAPATTG